MNNAQDFINLIIENMKSLGAKINKEIIKKEK